MIKKTEFPKILLACPTSEHKAYCQTDWIERVKQLTYPNLHVLIVDNSKTIDNSKELMRLTEDCRYRFTIDWRPSSKELRETLVDCCNVIRDYVVNNNYDYWFSLESDIFPPYNVIEYFLAYAKAYKKMVIAGLYFHFGGNNTMLLHYERHDLWGGNKAETHRMLNKTFYEDVGHFGLKQVYQCGVGCLLVDAKVFKKIKFRYDENEFKEGFHDYFFHADLETNNIGVFTDFSVICEHRNNSKRWEKLKPKGVVI